MAITILAQQIALDILPHEFQLIEPLKSSLLHNNQCKKIDSVRNSNRDALIARMRNHQSWELIAPTPQSSESSIMHIRLDNGHYEQRYADDVTSGLQGCLPHIAARSSKAF